MVRQLCCIVQVMACLVSCCKVLYNSSHNSFLISYKLSLICLCKCLLICLESLLFSNLLDFLQFWIKFVFAWMLLIMFASMSFLDGKYQSKNKHRTSFHMVVDWLGHYMVLAMARGCIMELVQFWSKKFGKSSCPWILKDCKMPMILRHFAKGIKKKHLAYPNVRREVLQYFHIVMLNDVDKRASWDCKLIEGSQSIHFVFYISNTYVTILNTHDWHVFMLNAWMTTMFSMMRSHMWTIEPNLFTTTKCCSSKLVILFKLIASKNLWKKNLFLIPPASHAHRYLMTSTKEF